jgi:hypothetical protein
MRSYFKKNQSKAAAMDPTCNLSFWEAEIGKIMVGGQPRQKVQEAPCQVMAGHGFTCLSSQLQSEAQIERS